jgi:putative transposase
MKFEWDQRKNEVVGVNKLIALSDGSFIENIRPTTNNRVARRLRIRTKAISRKVNGSKNKTKASPEKRWT